VNNKVHTSRRQRAAAELGRYTKVVSGNTFVGVQAEVAGVRSGMVSSVQADCALPLLGIQRTEIACRIATIRRCWAKPLIEALAVPVHCERQSTSSSISPELRWQHSVALPANARGFVDPQGITSRCSGTGIDKVHAHHCHASIAFSVRAPGHRRPPAELGR
jgi:hypothetical protein